MQTLIQQADWDKSYDGSSFQYDENRVAFRDLLVRYVPTGASCLEVGCFPGNFLLFMALRQGCTVSGIDATRHLPVMVSRFAQYPIRTGSFINERFEQVAGTPIYDCVTSFGFTPLRLPADLDFTALFHGVDERVPVESLEFGAKVFDTFLDLL